MRNVIFVISILFSSLNYGQNIAEHFKTNDFDIAIFPENHKELISSKRFSPTKEDVLKAEQALQSKLKGINSKLINQSSSPIIHKNLKKYKRQYFGCYDENRKKYLLINAFWSSGNNNDWLNRMIIVLDGGSYYWDIKYYFDDDDLKDLNVNGYS
jgi:hypothetical protein